jgi:hypothetical protein
VTREEYRQALAPYLPPPILERAVANYDGTHLRENHPYELIGSAFIWARTPEGEDFWIDVDRFVCGDAHELPPLPT